MAAIRSYARINIGVSMYKRIFALWLGISLPGWVEAGIPVTAPAAPVAVLVAPVLIDPADNVGYRRIDPVFRWRPVAQATVYRFQLSLTSTFAYTVIDDSTVTGVTRKAANLFPNAYYFWRVRAKNADGAGGWSEIRSFSTDVVTGTVQASLDREGFRILPGSRGYAGTDLEFRVKRGGYVRFGIINPANGRASELMGREFPAGIYRIPITRQGRGIFFLSMSAPGFRQTQKVFLP